MRRYYSRGVGRGPAAGLGRSPLSRDSAKARGCRRRDTEGRRAEGTGAGTASGIWGQWPRAAASAVSRAGAVSRVGGGEPGRGRAKAWRVTDRQRGLGLAGLSGTPAVRARGA